MLVPVSHLPAIPAASSTRVVRSLHRPQVPTRPRPNQPLSSYRPRPTTLLTPPHPQPTPTRMDPDQVTAAEVQHDDLGDTATSADVVGDSGGSGNSWGRALLRRGWDLSRKAAIAGVAATAAPVVAPPLLVLSVAGLALSFPFAAYLASVFATERLMGALLPPPRTQPFHTWDLEDDEFLDASEGPGGEDPVFDCWSETEEGAIMEEDESYASLPLSRECCLLEEPVPASSDNENPMAEGEFRLQESGYESFVFDNTPQKEEDNEYITMETPPPRTFDDSSSRSAAPELCEEDDRVPRIKEAPVAAEEPVQELSVSNNGDKTEDVKLKATEEMETSKEMVSLDIGIDSDTTGVSHFPVPDDSTLQSKIEDDVAVEMVLEEVTIDTNPVTEEVVGVEMEAIATELPECESLHLSDPVAQEPQMIAVAAYVDDVLGSTVTKDIVLDIGDTDTDGVEHIGVGDVSSVASVAAVDDVVDSVYSTRTLNVLAISDDKMNVESRPDVEPSNQTTGVENTWANKVCVPDSLSFKELYNFIFI